MTLALIDTAEIAALRADIAALAAVIRGATVIPAPGLFSDAVLTRFVVSGDQVPRSVPVLPSGVMLLTALGALMMWRRKWN